MKLISNYELLYDDYMDHKKHIGLTPTLFHFRSEEAAAAVQATAPAAAASDEQEMTPR